MPLPVPIAEDSSSSAPLCKTPPPRKPPNPKPHRARNALFDALAEATGSDPKAQGSFIGKVASDLARGDPPFTADDVRDFARRWRVLLPWANPADHPRLSLGIIAAHIHAVRDTPPRGADRPRARTAADNPDLTPAALAEVYTPWSPNGKH